MLQFAGALILVATLLDIGATTLTVGSGSRPPSGWFLSVFWRGALRLLQGHHHGLALVGPSLLALLVLGWALMLWLGWSLVFLSSPELAMVVADTEVPASAWQRVYFAGYTMTTLGPGGIEALGVWWQLFEVLTSFTGLVLATLGITFLLSVVSGVVDKRRLAADLNSLGETPAGVLTHAWDGTSWRRLEPLLADVSSDVHDIAQKHLAYPVLHYFHSPDRETALAPSLAVLDEALTMLIVGKDGDGIDALILNQFRKANAVFLETLRSGFLSADSPPPPPPRPDLDPLVDLAAPTTPQATWDERYASLADRRSVLRAFVRSDGWEWGADVHGIPTQGS